MWPRKGSPGRGFGSRPLNWLSIFAENPFLATPGPGEAPTKNRNSPRVFPKMTAKRVPRARISVSTPELAIVFRGESVSGHPGARGGQQIPNIAVFLIFKSTKHQTSPGQNPPLAPLRDRDQSHWSSAGHLRRQDPVLHQLTCCRVRDQADQVARRWDFRASLHQGSPDPRLVDPWLAKRVFSPDLFRCIVPGCSHVSTPINKQTNKHTHTHTNTAFC